MLFDLIRCRVISTGTGGPMTLWSADGGGRSFAAAGVPDGVRVSYGLAQGDQRETGRGVYDADAGTLTREFSASTTGSPIDLDGTAVLEVTPLAGDLMGLGFTDLTDPDAGEALACPAGEWVQVTRALAASPANARLRGDYAGHLFWQDGKIRPRGLGESVLFQAFFKVISFITDGFLLIEVRPGGNRTLNQGSAPIKLISDAGVEESGYTPSHVFNVRSTFAAQGAEVWVQLTRGGELLEFSPEFNPISLPVAQ